MSKKSVSDFEMKCKYWEVRIKNADQSEIEFEISFKEEKIPLKEMHKLEEAIRKILEACGRLERFQPSKR